MDFKKSFCCSFNLTNERSERITNEEVNIMNLKEVNLPSRHNLNPVSNVYEVVVISLLWAHSRLNEFPEIHFEFSLNLIGKLTMAFF